MQALNWSDACGLGFQFCRHVGISDNCSPLLDTYHQADITAGSGLGF